MGTDPEHAKAANEFGPVEGPHGPVHLVCADFQGASRRQRRKPAHRPGATVCGDAKRSESGAAGTPTACGSWRAQGSRGVASGGLRGYRVRDERDAELDDRLRGRR
jgi:hypothetical protein